MPREIQFNNPAFNGVQARQGTMYAPDEGEVFFTGGSNERYGDRNFNSPVSYIKGGKQHTIDPMRAFYNSPTGQLKQFQNELRNLYGVNGALGGNYGSTPNFGDPWNYIRAAGGDQTKGMDAYYKAQSDYWTQRNARDQKLVEDTINNSKFLTPEQKTAALTNVRAEIEKGAKASSAGRSGFVTGRLVFPDVTEGFISSTGIQLPGQDSLAMLKMGYDAIQKDLTAQGVNVQLSSLPIYNSSDIRSFGGIRGGGEGNIADAVTAYKSTQQATGNIGAQTNIQGYGPGAANYEEAQAAGFTGYDPNSTTPEQRARLAAEDAANKAAQGTDTPTGQSFSTATVPSPTAPQGTIPGYKGVYAGKENLLANDSAVNELFKQYHGRDANLEELNYWRNKKVGELENTLAVTEIFSGEDADKIRQQMMDQGLTYIRNQAELEQLAKTGQVSPQTLTNIGSQQTGMMFSSPTPTGGGGSGTGSGGGSGTGSGGGSGVGGNDGSGGGDLIDTIVNAVGDPNASDTEILEALNNLKNSQIDPYYRQVIQQAQSDVVQSINRSYEDRIRQLQTESFNMAENIKNTQKSLEGSGLTFSGEAIAKLGTLAAFGQSTPAGLTPAQLLQTGEQMSGGNVVPGQTLGQTAVGLPTMTPEQFGIEGSVNMQNRLYSESSRSQFNRGLEDIGQDALRYLGSQGIAGLGLPAQSTIGQPSTVGTLQYQYNNSLQNTYSGLANQEGNLTDYSKLFL